MTALIDQSAVIGVRSGQANSRISQAAIISVIGPPSTPSLITQAAIISVVMDNRKYVPLGQPIKLDCWQPCATYASYAKVMKIGE